jgi:RNA polymerase sigma-70 factor (ECF subfamily)
MSEPEINELSIEALRSGDREEFSRLVDEYSGPIYRLGLRMLGREQDAEDVLQNTFLKVMQHIGGFEGRSSLSTWIYRIAANEALMMLRRSRPEVNLEDQGNEDYDDFNPVQFVDWGSLPEDKLLTSEAKNILDSAIQSLPESLRVVFILRDIEGLSIKETSEALNLTETNVKTRLLRARLYLREKLSVYYGEHLPKEFGNG